MEMVVTSGRKVLTKREETFWGGGNVLWPDRMVVTWVDTFVQFH